MFRVPVNVTKKKSVILFAPGVIGEANRRETERPRVCVPQFTHVVDLIAVGGVTRRAVPITCLGKVIGGSGVV